MKDKLVFDTTNATTIADSDSVGAFLRASDGTLLTHTDVSGKKALDVRVAEGINVEVDLDHADDSVKIGDGTDFLAVNADGSINAVVTATNLDIRDLAFATDKVDVSGSEVSLDATTLAALENITVSATDLDIRDLAFATDSVTAHQGGTWTIDSITNAVTVTATNLDIRDLAFATDKVDVTGSEVSLDSATLAALENITVSATDLDIRDLTAASDSVQAWAHDGAGTALTSTLVSGKQALDVNIANTITTNDAALANTAIAAAAATLAAANTAQNAVASPLANRKYLFVYNNDNQKMFVGQSGVTSANGFPISPGSYLELRAGAAVDIEFVSTKLAHAIRTLELS